MSSAANRLLEHGIDLDQDGAPVGFQVGKAAALADWQHRQEKRRFSKLVAVLRAKRWRERRREHYNRWHREYERGLRATPEGRERHNRDRREYRERKAKARLAATPPWPCLDCSSPIHPKRGGGRKRLYCNHACQQRYDHHQKHPGARRLKPRSK